MVSIKNTEGVLPTDVTFGPHFGFDYIVPIKRKWSVFGGLAYRKVSVEGSSKSPIQVEILGNQTPSFVEADIYTSAQYEQYGLRAGANYELYRYSRNFKVNFSMGFGFLLRLKKHITLVFRLVIIFLVSIFRGAASSLEEQRAFVQGRTEEEMKILTYPLPILGLTTEYRF